MTYNIKYSAGKSPNEWRIVKVMNLAGSALIVQANGKRSTSLACKDIVEAVRVVQPGDADSAASGQSSSSGGPFNPHTPPTSAPTTSVQHGGPREEEEEEEEGALRPTPGI